MTPARADVAVVQKTVIDCPGLKQMLKEIPEERRGPLLGMMSPMLTGTPWITTTYVKGGRMREDMGQTTVVVNAESGKSFTLNRQTKAYSIGPYDPFQKTAGEMTCRVRPTHRTGTMLGHVVDIYDIAMTSSVLPKSQISGEIWAAPDLPTPPVPGYTTGTAAAFQSEMSKIKGMPLAYTVIYHNTPAGDIKVVSYATAISEKQLANAVFRIPSEFHRGATRMATKTPSAGFPLGDGMPLDSMNAVTNEMATGDAGGSEMSGMLGGGGGSGDISQMLARMSPEELQKLLSMAQGSGGMGQGLSGMSAGQLQQMLGGLSGGSGSTGDMSGMVNPQMLQQLSGELQSLMNDDE
jgi:hypothetical protein